MPEFEEWKLPFRPIIHYFIIYRNARTPLTEMFHSFDIKWSNGVLVFLPFRVSACIHSVFTILRGFYWADVLKWLNTTNIRWLHYIHILNCFVQVCMVLFSGPCGEANDLRHAIYKSIAKLHKEKGFWEKLLFLSSDQAFKILARWLGQDDVAYQRATVDI